MSANAHQGLGFSRSSAAASASASKQQKHSHATSTPERANELSCPLFHLPAEIRNQIYSMVVLKPFAMDKKIGSRNPRKPSTRTEQPALTRTCLRLRREVLPMYYGSNTFELDGTRYSPYLRPGGMLCNLDRAEFQGTMERNWEILRGFETVRRWLERIGERNRRFLGSVVVCCAQEDAGQLMEIAMVRFDFGRGCVKESVTCPLLRGWKWTGLVDESDVACFANERYRAGLKHYRVALVS